MLKEILAGTQVLSVTANKLFRYNAKTVKTHPPSDIAWISHFFILGFSYVAAFALLLCFLSITEEDDKTIVIIKEGMFYFARVDFYVDIR